MGYMRHRGMLVTSSNPALIEAAHEQAKRIYAQDPPLGTLMETGQGNFVGLVTPLVSGTSNGYKSFAILPDGSKEFWPPSDWSDSLREQFKAWLRSERVDEYGEIAWVEVNFGDDDGLPHVIASGEHDSLVNEGAVVDV